MMEIDIILVLYENRDDMKTGRAGRVFSNFSYIYLFMNI